MKAVLSAMPVKTDRKGARGIAQVVRIKLRASAMTVSVVPWAPS